VTLGGTGKESGDRHPKVEDNVLLGAAAKVLGNIRIGKGALIAPGSLVLKPVAPDTMVAGAPAQFVGRRQVRNQCDQLFHAAAVEYDNIIMIVGVRL
jgi:serine acetyltransferase